MSVNKGDDMMSDATEQHRLRWKCETELATLRAEVEGVRHPIYNLMRVIARSAIAKPGFIHDDTLHDWAQELEDVDNILTAALDAAPAPGDTPQAYTCQTCWSYVHKTCKGMSSEYDVSKCWEPYWPDAPVPVGIAAADVVVFRDKLEAWASKISYYSPSGKTIFDIIADLTALIDAAGEQVPSVPLSVVEPLYQAAKYLCDQPNDIPADKFWKDLQAAVNGVRPHRTAPPAASEPVCETCEDKHAITCDDYRECINPEKCAWGKVCKDGVFPCPDCATAPRTPTILEQRITQWLEDIKLEADYNEYGPVRWKDLLYIVERWWLERRPAPQAEGNKERK